MGRPTSRPTDHERGAALVEFAILIPLLVMLLFGIVSAGLAFSHQLSLTHAAREAGRYAATLPVSNFNADPDPLRAWLDEVAARAVEDATGSLADGLPGRAMCVAYVYPNGALATDKTTTLRVDQAGNHTYDATTGNPCFGDTRPDAERRVQVHVQRDVEFGVVLFSTTLTIDSDAVSKFEAGGGL